MGGEKAAVSITGVIIGLNVVIIGRLYRISRQITLWCDRGMCIRKVAERNVQRGRRTTHDALGYQHFYSHLP